MTTTLITFAVLAEAFDEPFEVRLRRFAHLRAIGREAVQDRPVSKSEGWTR